MDVERRVTVSQATVEERCECEKTGEKKPVIVGYAAVFNSESRNLGGFVESIHPRAFDAVLEANPDVIGVFNHDRNKLLGRVSNGSLKLKADDYGLRYEITPPNTQEARDVVELVRGGYVGGSSFAFAVKKDGGDAWTTDEKGRRKREIRSVDLLEDVGPVVRPAYGASTVVVSRRAMEIALGEAFRANQTMANSAKRGLKQAAKLENADQMLVGVAERMANREILTADEISRLQEAHKKASEVRNAGWHGSPAWVEWQLAGGDAGERWVSRRAEELAAVSGDPEQPAEEIRAEQPEEEKIEEPSEVEEESGGNLSPNNYHLYESIEQIADDDGKWPQAGADGAHYMDESPFAAKGLNCANCVFFNEGGSCDVVDGAIAPGGLCRLWIITEDKLAGMTVEEKPAEMPAPEEKPAEMPAPEEKPARRQDDAATAMARLKAAALGSAARRG